MCADKFRRVYPLQITFSDGETPSSQKLTAVANQARSGSNLFEYAIGDVWNESGDSILEDFELQIPNIARLIGQNKLLNPAIYHLKNDFTFYDQVGINHNGQHSGHLRFLPTGTVTKQTAGNISGTIYNNNPASVSSLGDANLDTSTGELFLYHNSGFAGTEILSYNVDPDSWIAEDEYLPSVIPDPRQVAYTKCRLEDMGSSIYKLHLPPRTRLAFTDPDLRPNRYPSATEAALASNEGTTGSPYKLFHPITGTASGDGHYRYQLPQEITLSTMITGDQIPYGFIYLWDHTNKTIVRDAIFKKTTGTGSDEWVIQVESVSADSDFSAAATAGETETDYSSGRYSLICVGASIANTLKTLYKMSTTHTHSNAGDMSAIIPHNNLGYRDPKPSEMDVSFAPSQWINDPHISLLSRAGFSSTARDTTNNAMLGNLVFAGTNNVLDVAGVSHRIRFGNNSGPSIYGNGTYLILNDSGGNVGIGNSSPTYKLDVTGNGRFTTGLFIPDGQKIDLNTDGSGNSAQLYFDSDRYIALETWQFIFSVHQNQDFIWKDGSVERMRITNTNGGAISKIGIGTSTPVNKLDVEGAVAIGAAYSGTSTAPTNGLLVQGNVSVGTTTTTFPLHVNAGSSDNAALFESTDSNCYINLRDNNTTNNTNNGLQVNGDNLYIRSGGSPHITVVGSTGSIGINELSPDTRLHISHSTAASTDAFLKLENTNGGTNNAGGISFVRDSTERAKIHVDELEGISFWTKDGVGALTERIRIKKDGVLSAQNKSVVIPFGPASMIVGVGDYEPSNNRMLMQTSGSGSDAGWIPLTLPATGTVTRIEVWVSRGITTANANIKLKKKTISSDTVVEMDASGSFAVAGTRTLVDSGTISQAYTEGDAVWLEFLGLTASRDYYFHGGRITVTLDNITYTKAG